jgi:hypothetical protein
MVTGATGWAGGAGGRTVAVNRKENWVMFSIWLQRHFELFRYKEVKLTKFRYLYNSTNEHIGRKQNLP